MRRMKTLLFLSSMLLTIQLGVAEESLTAEAPALDFRTPCKSISTEEGMSGQNVARPRLTPKYPPKQPEYPADALRPGETRTVVMQLLVNEKGRVSQAKVQTSSGSAAFDLAAMKATKDWRLEPGRANEKAACMWFRFVSTGVGSK
jgi:TonB family protein